ncbi:MAG: TSUP family transporter [Methylococcales bacterium]|nr:TSUP family transporter [Methylococcales bacterium]
MAIDILLTVFITSIIQSIFGVGVLLFGTPILLLLGYDFANTLSILLPISIAINLLQLIKHYQHIDFKFYKNVLIYTLPFIVLFLFIGINSQLNIGLIVGAFLLFVALKNSLQRVEKILDQWIKYERSYLIIMGLVHGLTNLGGSLLTAIVHGKNYSKKCTRITVAACYATFAVVQLITLGLLDLSSTLSYSDHISYLQIGVIVFLLSEEFLYQQLNNNRYRQIFAAFLFISGCLLMIKSL